MPFELFLALRYLRPRRGGRLGSAQVTALAGVTGIACGVAALVAAMALANGFRDEMRDKILRGTAHVTVAHAGAAKTEDWRALAARVGSAEGVRAVTPTTYAGALLSGPDGAAYAVVRGVEAGSARELSDIRAALTSGSVEELFRPLPESARGAGDAKAAAESRADDQKSGGESLAGVGSLDAFGLADDGPPVAVVVGAELAARTGLRAVGDEALLLAGERIPEPPGLAPRARRVRVAGLFRTGLHEFDATWAYAALPEAVAFTNDAPVLSVETSDIYRAQETAARIRQTLGPNFSVVDWQEANRPLFAALELERRTVALIVALIVAVAALNITTTLVLVVVERRADIAILTAVGARARSVVAIFVAEGAIVGAVGAAFGVALGLLVCYFGDRYRLVSLPAEVYSLSSIPFRPRAVETALAALAAFFVCVLATLYPARRAARMRPAEAFRYE
jgi:lipoprotein-releasing system permease protein